MRHKICLIICYFGKFPNYFQLWLNSCAGNKDIDFLIFTDNKDRYNYPPNVKVIYTLFEEIKNKIQQKFDFKISLEKPYKLCDYKPTYGFVFHEYLKEYDFWGHCDLDVIWGNLQKYLTEEDLEKYDKLYANGHFTIYKNTKKINENFKELIDEENNKPLYLKVFQNNQSFLFDETAGIIKLYDGQKYKMLNNRKVIADISIKYNNLVPVKVEKEESCIFHFYSKNKINKLIGIYKEKDKIVEIEFMYIHLQKRKMNVCLEDENDFYIVPNRFVNINHKLNNKTIKKYTYRYTILRCEYIYMKLKKIKEKMENIWREKNG